MSLRQRCAFIVKGALNQGLMTLLDAANDPDAQWREVLGELTGMARAH